MYLARRDVLLRFLFFGIAILPIANAQGGGISIWTPGPATAGKTYCFLVNTADQSTGPPAVEVQFNGVPLPPGLVGVFPSEEGDGTWVVCVRVPASTADGTLTITVASGGSFGTQSVPVLAPH